MPAYRVSPSHNNAARDVHCPICYLSLLSFAHKPVQHTEIGCIPINNRPRNSYALSSESSLNPVGGLGLILVRWWRRKLLLVGHQA